MAQYAVMRLGKVKTMGDIGGLGKHNERARETRNADGRRWGENVRLAGTGDWRADVQARLDVAPIIRSNAVLAIDHVLTASPEWFEQGTVAEQRQRLADWTQRSMAWLRETYGAENVVAAVLHRDERTPHIQAVVVPIDERGRLNAYGFIGGSRGRLAELQDTYAEKVRDLGLIRGVRGSVAEHETVKEWYAKIQTPTPAPEIVRESVSVDRPGRIVGNPERWASEQTERIVGELTPTLDDALTKAAHYEGQAATAEANIVVLQERVQALERDYRTLAAQARSLDLRVVIERLGGERDHYDVKKWRLDGEHITITGEKFYNHDRREGGGGAIDLVKHATGYDFKQAVVFLDQEVGRELALSAAAHHGAREAQEQAAQVIARGEQVRFVAPAPAADRWPQVRAYLIEQRGLPRGMVDALHERGDIYADGRANAVFGRRDEGRAMVGASLRGTLPGSEFQGLARGTRRDEGHFSFSYTIGKPGAYDTPQYHITESPIDAMSRAALVMRAGETGTHVFIATDGQGALPRRQIDEALTSGALVRCGFDNDQGGTQLWARVKEAYPNQENIERERPPGGAKDWNDALRAPTPERGRSTTPERTTARTDYHDR